MLWFHHDLDYVELAFELGEVQSSSFPEIRQGFLHALDVCELGIWVFRDVQHILELANVYWRPF